MRWRWPLLSCLLLLMFWQYLYCVLMVGYNYAWWVLFSGTVSMASPGERPNYTCALCMCVHADVHSCILFMRNA
eukprot:365679-Chlamydomonas_euryale.AAC.27